MRKKMLLLCAAAGAGMIAFAEVTPTPKPPANPEVTEMRNEIERLKAKVEMLDLRTKSLESTVEQMKRSRVPSPLNFQGPAPSLTVPSLSAPKPPTIWGQGEVNGWTYYIVPCEQPSR